MHDEHSRRGILLPVHTPACFGVTVLLGAPLRLAQLAIVGLRQDGMLLAGATQCSCPEAASIFSIFLLGITHASSRCPSACIILHALKCKQMQADTET